jgi:DNA-binding NarL/FixJ family response regulator
MRSQKTLSSIDGFEVVGVATDRARVIPIALRVRPTVSILSMGMMGCDGLRLAAELRVALSACGIAFIAAKPTRAQVDRAVEVGTLSVVPKTRETDAVSWCCL